MEDRVRKQEGSDSHYYRFEVQVGQLLDRCGHCGALVAQGEGTQAHNQFHQRVGWGNPLHDPPAAGREQPSGT